jgi:hypothetical protein
MSTCITRVAGGALRGRSQADRAEGVIDSYPTRPTREKGSSGGLGNSPMQDKPQQAAVSRVRARAGAQRLRMLHISPRLDVNW